MSIQYTQGQSYLHLYEAQSVSLCERMRQVNRKKIVEAALTKYDILYTDGAVRSYSAVVEHSR